MSTSNMPFTCRARTRQIGSRLAVASLLALVTASVTLAEDKRTMSENTRRHRGRGLASGAGRKFYC